METRQRAGRHPGEWTLVAQFGEARLIRHVSGSLQLRGGTPADRAEAHDWIVRFLRQHRPKAAARA
ncbi:MAG: hypothetical protein D6766_03980 [Verrucomicrobia bacterium]|nr:MAG: hypothetical protein D6766_03980 [Verrucomicrobiota bacterium]